MTPKKKPKTTRNAPAKKVNKPVEMPSDDTKEALQDVIANNLMESDNGHVEVEVEVLLEPTQNVIDACAAN